MVDVDHGFGVVLLNPDEMTLQMGGPVLLGQTNQPKFQNIH